MSFYAILMILSLLGLIVIGVPIAFAISSSVLIYVLLAGFPPLSIAAQQTVMGLNSFVLLALPLFIWAGILMERGGATDGLMRLVLYLLGKLPGGALVASVVATTFFGALTGSAVAATAAIGQIMLPQLARQGYPAGLAVSLQAGSGVLGSVIPPSIALVTYGAIAGASISSLFLGAVVPGIIMASLLAAYAVFASFVGGYGQSERPAGETLGAVLIAAIPALFTPGIILGLIFSGIATATEAAAVGCVYALLVGVLVYRRLDMRGIWDSLIDATRSTAAIAIIIAASAAFAWIVAAEGLAAQVATMIFSISDHPVVVMILINVVLLILGCFMETIAIIVILTPIMAPIAAEVGIHPVQFGVIMILNLAIGGITPPLGVCLFTAARILKLDITDAFPHLIYVILTMIIGLLIVILFPSVVTWVL